MRLNLIREMQIKNAWISISGIIKNPKQKITNIEDGGVEPLYIVVEKHQQFIKVNSYRCCGKLKS
jgi:hypothetical protein